MFESVVLSCIYILSILFPDNIVHKKLISIAMIQNTLQE